MRNSTKKVRPAFYDDPAYREKLRQRALKNPHFNDPAYREQLRQRALKNPYFNGEKNHIVASNWTEEHRAKCSQHMIKYNKSRAGRKMASKRQKEYFKDPANRQKLADIRLNEPKDSNVNKARIKHGYTTFQKDNQERHMLAEKKKAIERAREMYRSNNVKPIIKPLPNQPDEYYDALDEFFAEGF